MGKISLNSVSPTAFSVNGVNEREDIIAKGRMLFFEHSVKGKNAMLAANGANGTYERLTTDGGYKTLNEKFQREHMLYAAKIACAQTGMTAPSTWEEFKKQGRNFYKNNSFFAVLQGIYQEVINPILPAVYSEAVSTFADTVEVDFGETYAVSISSNDIPVFQDSSWGASLAVPANRFYTKDYYLNPLPRTADMKFKWFQLLGNMDFGMYFANITAGLYAKTFGLWNAALTAAASDTTKIPNNLKFVFSDVNWGSAADLVGGLNDTAGLYATGSRVALSKVLPTSATGSANTTMDAALATLLGTERNERGFLGKFLGVPLIPLRNAIVPGTQNSAPATMLSANQVWMLSANGRKPMTIGYNSATPITIEMTAEQSADFEVSTNVTIALDTISVFSSKVALITV